MNEITDLISINGFDPAATESWDEVKAVLQKKAAIYGKRAITIDTNVRTFLLKHGSSMDHAHGSVLGGLATAIGPRRGYIPSTYTYRELQPWGSHPLLDPLWSTESTEIVHDAAELRRSEKTAVIAANADVLAQLQVCWKSKVSNCGACPKCARTMLALKILGLGPGPFPDINPVPLIGLLKPTSNITAAFAWDLWKLAENRGQTEIAAKFRRMIRRYKLGRAASGLVKELIGPRATKAIHRLRGARWVDSVMPFSDPDDLK